MVAALHNDDIEIGEILHSAGPELPGLVNDDGVLLQVGQRRCEQLITCTGLSQASSCDMSLATGQCVEDLSIVDATLMRSVISCESAKALNNSYSSPAGSFAPR